MDLLNLLMPVVTSIVGAVIGWMTGRRKRDNDLIQAQLETVNSVLDNNRSIVQKYSEAQNEIMTLRRERIEQDDVIEKLKNEVESLKRKNEQLNRKLNELQRKLNKLIEGEGSEE